MKLLESVGNVLVFAPVVLLAPWLGIGIALEPTATETPTWWALGVVVGASVSGIGFALVALALWRGQ